jgi:hypothetical protein
MGVTEELYRLGQSARRLNDGSDLLDRSLAEIDRALGRLTLGFEFQLPRPIAEQAHHDRDGKRIIEVSYLGYMQFAPVENASPQYHLAVRTLKVFEGRRTSEEPGRVQPLLEAPRAIRHAAVDHLPTLVAGLAGQVDEMVAHIERRNAIATAILGTLGESSSG